MRKFSIILLILWMIVIFMFSQESADSSSEKSDSVANVLVDIISNVTGKDYTGNEFINVLDNCIVIVRKSAHFLEYLILGILMINVVKNYKDINNCLFFISLLFCIMYAISDEVHQLFIPGRSCEILDVLIDSTGSLIGIFIYYLFNSRRLKERVKHGGV